MLVIGAKRPSELARSRGTGMREFKHALDVEPATSDPPSPRHARQTRTRNPGASHRSAHSDGPRDLDDVLPAGCLTTASGAMRRLRPNNPTALTPVCHVW